MLNSSEQDISELAHNLKQERLFIDCEKQQLRILNEQVSCTIIQLISILHIDI